MMSSKSAEKDRQSALPSILDAYVSPRSIVENGEKKQPLKVRKCLRGEDEERLTESPEHSPDSEASRRAQAAMEQRHLQAYRNINRLRDVLHRRYSDLLREKIQKQRLDIKQRCFTTPKYLKHLGIQKEKNIRRQKLPFCTLTHDETHLKSLHKTNYYLIIDLQNQMMRNGWLKTHCDQEEFWALARQNQRGSELEKRLQDVREKMISSRSAPDLKSLERIKQETSDPEQMKLIASITGLREQAALSERDANGWGPAHHLRGRLQQEMDAIGQMFPKVPKFVTLQPAFLDLLKSFPELRISDTSQKTTCTDASLRKLHHMHSLTLTNMAASQRLLLNRGTHCPLWDDEGRDWNLHEYLFPTEVLRVNHGKIRKPPCPRRSPQAPSGQPETTSTLEPDTDAVPDTEHPKGILLTETQSEHREANSTKSPDPLSLEQACQKHPSAVTNRRKSRQICHHFFPVKKIFQPWFRSKNEKKDLKNGLTFHLFLFI
ncbi:uncharacterized protein LOC125738497 isoform X2 [Brienomyrus brachyistius]|uniref:uncharacterized protein LOC125738497 isoform X2 n=1 Tax=Brienomyrus brachyistius TaxID=42636 RepID=UPI0020B17CF1|nr:uncharacterized protein LOC125738497 isoform X2 [Brienomyrus brachyistius]